MKKFFMTTLGMSLMVMGVTRGAQAVTSKTISGPVIFNKTPYDISIKGSGARGRDLCLLTIVSGGEKDLSSTCKVADMEKIHIEKKDGGSKIGTISRKSFVSIRSITIMGTGKDKGYSYKYDDKGPFVL